MTSKDLTTEQVQAIMRDLLQDLTRFAAEHNKPVILLGGSLLGHVRHRGFIPWDDDVDVGMMRTDYEWLATHYVPSDARFRLMLETDVDSYVPYMRLVDTESFAHSPYYQVPHGVFIDIFPIDAVDAQPVKRKVYLIGHKVLNILRNVARSTGAYAADAKIVPVKKALRKIIKSKNTHSFSIMEIRWANAYRKRMKTHTESGVLNGMHGQKEFYPRELWQALTPVMFEGSQVWHVQDVDLYLTQLFGDWQTPVKHEQQHAHFWINEE